MGSNLETRSLLDELRNFDKGGFFDFGHPLLNRIAESFVKAAGIGAIQAVSREAYFTALKGFGTATEISATKKHRFPDLRGETNRKSLEAMVKSTGKESLQWGLAAGMYSGLTYGLKEARGAHDWKNSAVAGAITGMALALTTEDSSHETIVQCAITGHHISDAMTKLRDGDNTQNITPFQKYVDQPGNSCRIMQTSYLKRHMRILFTASM